MSGRNNFHHIAMIGKIGTHSFNDECIVQIGKIDEMHSMD